MKNTAEVRLDLYRKMLLIRAFEMKVNELLAAGSIHGTSHLCVGQEAVAAGACAALKDTDFVVSNHRGHGHFLAKGGDPDRIMAELWGKADGYSRGRGGSQHIACKSIGFLGSNGITGGGLPIATGAALALRMRNEDSVVVCFLGDGASNQGTFHESLNMSSLWELPIIFICENNLYGMSTHVSRSTSVPDIADRAAAYNMSGLSIDGNDVMAVMNIVSAETGRLRKGGRPVLIECKTYRHLGHSRSDRCDYRSNEEENEWKQRDPILRLGRRLKEEDLLNDESDAALRRQQESRVEASVQFARNSPFPDPSEIEGSQYHA